MNAEFVKHALLLAKDVESKIDRALYLGYGSLLGAIREGRVIHKDSDLDFIVVFVAKDKADAISQVREFIWRLKKANLLSKVFVRGGWLWENELHSIDDIQNITGQFHAKNNRATIDIWSDFIIDGEYINGCFGSFGDASQFVTEDLGIIQFEGYEFYIPANTDKMLELIYGNWRIPKPGSKRGKGLSKRKDFLL